MEFRRIEVVRIVREARRIATPALSKEVFDKLMDQAMTFSIRTTKFGPYKDCVVLSTTDSNAFIRARDPKVRIAVPYNEVEYVEVESNREVLEYTEGEDGRWEQII